MFAQQTKKFGQKSQGLCLLLVTANKDFDPFSLFAVKNSEELQL